MKDNIFGIKRIVVIIMLVSISYCEKCDNVSVNQSPSNTRIVAQYVLGTTGAIIGGGAGWLVIGGVDDTAGLFIGSILGSTLGVKLIGDFQRVDKGTYIGYYTWKWSRNHMAGGSR